MADDGSTGEVGGEVAGAADSKGSGSTFAFMIYALFVAALILGFAYVRLFLDHPMGDSIKNLISYSMGIFYFIGSALWAVAMAPTSWSKRFLIAGVFLSPLAVAAAVVRDVDFSGDMQMTLKYRWDKPDSEQRRASVVAPSVSSAPAVTVTEGDYAEYRGRLRDGVLAQPDVDFSGPSAEAWRVKIGAGWAGMAVVDSVVVTIEQIGGDEAIVCFDAETGAEYWRNTYAASFDEAMGGPGPRSTPTVDGGQVFAYGAEGHLTCCDLSTGETVWQVDTLDKFGVSNVTWATSGSPLVRGDRVYVNTGSTKDGGLTCFDRGTGDVVWRASQAEWDTAGDNAAGYASPMFAVIDGVEQIVMFDGVALRGHAVDDGSELWSHPYKNDPLVNVAQPIVFEDGRIFIAASYAVGCEMLKVTGGNAWTVESVWKEPRLMKCKFTSPVAKDGFLYGLDEGVLECLNAETGERMWKKGRYGHGQVLLSGDQILVMAEDGRFVVVRATPEKFEQLSETPVFDAARNWNPPSVSRGRVFLRNHEQMVRLDFEGGKTVAGGYAAVVDTGEEAVTNSTEGVVE